MKELHLFIIWENALYKKDEIIQDIKNNFTIIKIYNMSWSKELFSDNLSRFYGTNLPKGSGKEVHCGNGSFYLIIVQDNNPEYKIRNTSKGDKLVNTNMFDKKTYYRELTGGGHKVHTTNSLEETNHDLTLLLDKNAEDFLKEYNDAWTGNIEEVNKDLFGAKGWETVEDMFYALNNCCKYALLRNYESLPEEIYYNEHNDIDLICESYEDCAYVLNAESVFPENYRIHYKTKVKDNYAFFDLRYIGDDYYCYYLEQDILNNRVYNSKGFYTISNEFYFHTLLYHALIHKPSFSNDYKNRLQNMNGEFKEVDDKKKWLEILEEWLDFKKYMIVKPTDKSVYFNTDNINITKQGAYEKVTNIDNILLENEKLKEEIDKLFSKNNEISSELNAIKSEIKGIYLSKSWRYTDILRKIRKKLKK